MLDGSRSPRHTTQPALHHHVKFEKLSDSKTQIILFFSL